MSQMAKAGWSSVAKKLLNGITGIGLIVFVILHLGGNLTLLSPDPDTFNTYAHRLTELGLLLYVAEIGLLLLFLAHIVSALYVWVQNRSARSERYFVHTSRGKPSRKSTSSITMIYTGLILLAFVVWHVATFRFGPGIKEGYVTYINGEEARDLYRLVVEFFSNPLNVLIYVAVMILLGFHLRHGFWSAFQSIGVNHPKYSPIIYAFGIVAAFVLAIGFLILPIWLYFRGGA